MRLGTARKQPGEKRRWAIDYTEALDDGDLVESASVAVDPAGLTAQALVSPSTNKVRLVVSGGVSGSTYKITVTMETTNTNEIFEDELLVKVVDL